MVPRAPDRRLESHSQSCQVFQWLPKYLPTQRSVLYDSASLKLNSSSDSIRLQTSEHAQRGRKGGTRTMAAATTTESIRIAFVAIIQPQQRYFYCRAELTPHAQSSCLMCNTDFAHNFTVVRVLRRSLGRSQRSGWKRLPQAFGDVNHEEGGEDFASLDRSGRFQQHGWWIHMDDFRWVGAKYIQYLPPW